MLAADLCKR